MVTVSRTGPVAPVMSTGSVVASVIFCTAEIGPTTLDAWLAHDGAIGRIGATRSELIELVRTATAAGLQVSTVSMLARAQSLRVQARRVNPVLAEAYLRRSAELRMEAWARTARVTATPLEGFAAPRSVAAA